MKQFITDEEWKLLQEANSKEIFNSILNRLHNMTIEAAILQLPITMEIVTKNALAQQAITKKFYDNNPTFIPNKHLVIEIVQNTEEANPGKSYEEILNIAKEEIDRRISNMKLADGLSLDIPKKDSMSTNINGEI